MGAGLISFGLLLGDFSKRHRFPTRMHTIPCNRSLAYFHEIQRRHQNMSHVLMKSHDKLQFSFILKIPAGQQPRLDFL